MNGYEIDDERMNGKYLFVRTKAAKTPSNITTSGDALECLNINTLSSDWSVGHVALLEKKVMVECYDRVHDQLATQESNISIDTADLLSSSVNTSSDEYMYQPRQITNILLDVVVVVVVHKKKKNKNRDNTTDNNNSNKKKKRTKNNNNDTGNDFDQEENNRNRLEFSNL